MTEQQTYIVSQARSAAMNIISHDVPAGFVFHNIQHTEDVVNSLQALTRKSGLCDLDEFILSVSAWFHDTGFSKGSPDGHEDESIKLVTAFLNDQQTATESINLITSCIRATRMPQAPGQRLEQILCDADLYHLGTDAYLRWNELLKQELEYYQGNEIADENWRQASIDFLRAHSFFTTYAQDHLETVKQTWLQHLEVPVQ